MPAFCEDEAQITEYPNGIVDEPREPGTPFIKCLQWDDSKRRGSENNEPRSLPDAQSLIEIAEGRQSALRVVFLPIIPAKHSDKESKCFRKLIDYYSIPSAVLAERMRRVSYSFGNSTLVPHNAEIAWSHFICRNVDVKEGVIQDLGYLNEDQGTPGLVPSSLWSMCDFYLHVRPESTEESEQGKAVTLLCFGAPKEVVERFHRLLHKRDAWCEILLEPYLLFDILFDQLHELFDNKVWRLSDAVRPEEKAALKRAVTLGSDGDKINFQNLHNIQKNTIFLIEAAESSIATLEAIACKLREPGNGSLARATATSIEYRKRNFHSTLLRLTSLEKRMSNIIQLSFNLVTQADSGVMKADSAVLKTDSRAMKFIAFLTLVFLPATGVASVFSTPFFNIDWDTSPQTGDKVLKTARSFWIFWAVVLPLTIVGLLLCFVWVNLPENYKNLIKAELGRLAKSGRRTRERRQGKVSVERHEKDSEKDDMA